MKIPQSPPPWKELWNRLADQSPQALEKSLLHAQAVNSGGRYLHWDEMRHRTPPLDMTLEQWWLGTAVARRSFSRRLPCSDVDGRNFKYCNVDLIQETTHWIDQQASGRILADDSSLFRRSANYHLVGALLEEVITSSQLEGAATTRSVAKELIHTGRKPNNKDEQMVLNNYRAMEAVIEWGNEKNALDLDLLLELHRIVTIDTLENPRDAGHLQTSDEDRVSVYWLDDDTLLHRPPRVAELGNRLENLCKFVNGGNSEGFMHPVVRAIIAHFWLAYDHPFADGNGRTARALFYWVLLRSGYWLARYFSISSILQQVPAQYARSFLYVKTDDGDLTYFIAYHLRVIKRAISGLSEYVQRKASEMSRLQSLLEATCTLNHRQVTALRDALKDPSQPQTFRSHMSKNRVVYQTARTDLSQMVELGLFSQRRIGKAFYFTPEEGIEKRLGELAKETE